ncbi:hypothetical protein KP509_16G080300 [Ceratopteris richardii]|uniref:Uncharacterized protein n=1 Tax=Ceratopteris richardii TaxID=49495 RepID=A0A8T2T272_CERRI|nr:hypothetical protein KP509_16G080300 [Ceratopteris richardii]
MAMSSSVVFFCAGSLYGIYVAQNYNVPDVAKLFKTVVLMARIYEESYRKRPPRDDDSSGRG